MRTLILVLCLTSSAQASTITTLGIGALVDDAITPPVGFQVLPGELFAAVFFFDSVVVGVPTEEGTFYNFTNYLGEFVTATQIDIINLGYQITIKDGDAEVPSDEFLLTSDIFTFSDGLQFQAQIQMIDETGTAWDSEELPLNMRVEDFSSTLMTYSFLDENGSFVGEISGDVIGIVYAVPEPSNTVLLLGAIHILGMRQRKRRSALE